MGQGPPRRPLGEDGAAGAWPGRRAVCWGWGGGRLTLGQGLSLGPRSWAARASPPAVRQHQGQGPRPHLSVVSLLPCRLGGPCPGLHVEELVLRAGGGVVVPVCSPSPALLPGPEVSFPSALLRAGLGQVSEAWNSGVCLLTCGSPPVSC